MLQEMLHWLGFGLCHQLAERSFFGGGVQVPVCARDTGIYVGFVVSLAIIAALSRGKRPSEMPSIPLMVLGILFVVAMGLDGVTSYGGLRETTNDLRLITGLTTGFALPLALVPILNGQVWRRPGPERVLEGRRAALVWVAAVPVAFVVVRWLLPLYGVVFPLLVGAAIVFTFGAVNLAIVCLLPAFERRYQRLREAWLPMLLSLLLTAVELTATGLLRGVVERAAGIG